MMKIFNLLTILYMACNQTNAQENNEKFFIVSIETLTNNRLHKAYTDYWLLSLKQWDENPDEALMPLYLYNYSDNDFNECCTDKSLVLFNPTTEETFNLNLKINEKIMLKMLKNNRKKVQRIKKKWTDNRKEEINIYIKPVSGIFCVCEFTCKNISSFKYNGQVAIPYSDIIVDNTTWNLPIVQQILNFDFSILPLVSLHSIQ